MTTIKEISVRDLTINPAAQRKFSPIRIERMVLKGYDRSALGVISVNYRGGRYFVMDGQHRVALALRVEGPDATLMAEIWDELSPDQEAAMFDVLNDYLVVPSHEKFRIRVAAGKHDYLVMNDIVERAGFVVGESKANALVACGALEGVYYGKGIRDSDLLGPFPDVLIRTLDILVQAFGVTSASVHGQLVGGIGLFLHRYGHVINDADLVARLQVLPAGPRTLRAQALNVPGSRRSAPERMCYVILEIWNTRRRSKILS